MCLLFFFFFFSSRRRHTRCSRDWSSDVCSSDLRDFLEREIGLPMAHVEATYLAWIDCSSLGVADPHAHFLAHGVALSPGAQFGEPRFARLNFGTQRARLRQALERIRSASRPSPRG